MLTAPFGFETYYWYANNDFSNVIGYGQTLTVSPPPANGTVYAVAIYPFFSLGCPDTLYTTIDAKPDVFTLQVQSSIITCNAAGVNLTDPSVTAGSTPNITFSYFTDAQALDYLAFPGAVTTSGVYYIKGVNNVGCSDVKPIAVSVLPAPDVITIPIATACFPAVFNLTDAAVTSGSTPGLSYTYWTDVAATLPVADATAVGSGTYYIKGTSADCSAISQPVIVRINQPAFVARDLSGCGSVDLTAPGVTSGSNSVLQYTYWSDAAALAALGNPKKITQTGTYFIKGTDNAGCTVIKPVNATVSDVPVFTVTDPAPVVYPATVDISGAYTTTTGSYTFSFWQDAAATRRIDPLSIATAGTYYIQALSGNGCTTIHAVTVTILPPPPPTLVIPNTFSPNGDGVHDEFAIQLKQGEYAMRTLKVFDRWGREVFESKSLSDRWNGRFNGKPLPVGTYYYVLEGEELYDHRKIVHSGSITLLR
jgi:gliding motility-associated-like protein